MVAVIWLHWVYIMKCIAWYDQYTPENTNREHGEATADSCWVQRNLRFYLYKDVYYPNISAAAEENMQGHLGKYWHDQTKAKFGHWQSVCFLQTIASRSSASLWLVPPTSVFIRSSGRMPISKSPDWNRIRSGTAWIGKRWAIGVESVLLVSTLHWSGRRGWQRTCCMRMKNLMPAFRKRL